MAVTLAMTTPTDGGLDVSRSSRIVLTLSDDGGDVLFATLAVRLRQVPYPAQSADGWEDLITAGVVLEDDAFEVTPALAVGLGASFALTLRPRFGWLPGATYYVDVTVDGQDTSTYNDTFSFTVVDAASVGSPRTEFTKFERYAARWGWTGLLQVSDTYTFESVGSAYDGSRVQLVLNESLLADWVDQVSESLFGLDILNGTRRYKLLVREGGFATDVADAQASELLDQSVDVSITYPVMSDRRTPVVQNEVFETVVVPNRVADQITYFSLFVLLPPTSETLDWSWAFVEGITSAVVRSHAAYGHADKLVGMMPDAWQVLDAEQT